ncbi:hypothetical protein EVA_16059 [gut metagenome]|uniref:Uncharacterized protein n=1 Tax=gut metagenome TaxID=749906 RepID=J9G1Y7_9ZZZZ
MFVSIIGERDLICKHLAWYLNWPVAKYVKRQAHLPGRVKTSMLKG